MMHCDQEVAMSRFTLPAACLVSLALAGVAAAQEDEGQLAFNTQCRNCHTTKKDDNRVGPSLHGIVGAQAGQVKGYSKYSGALEGITWDEATLDKFIADPQSVAPGTNMSYPPVHDPAQRKKIIEFLQSQNAAE
jgi:cytochrome c